MPHTLYDTIKSQRQNDQNISKLYNRIMIAGYLHQQNCKKYSHDPQKIIKQTIAPYRQNNNITGYLYIKGYFYIHILESIQIQSINLYMKNLSKMISSGGRLVQSHRQVRIVYQSYESQQQLFKGYDCDNSSQQAGPILIQSDKLQQQILDRSIEIYQFFEQGAKTKRINPSHRIGNMILLNNDDMSILEYMGIYCDQVQITKQSDMNYPLPPNMFKMIEFMQIDDDYKRFVE